MSLQTSSAILLAAIRAMGTKTTSRRRTTKGRILLWESQQPSMGDREGKLFTKISSPLAHMTSMCCSDDHLPSSEELDAMIPYEELLIWPSPERLVILIINNVELT
jgi:hypothetical protein